MLSTMVNPYIFYGQPIRVYSCKCNEIASHIGEAPKKYALVVESDNIS